MRGSHMLQERNSRSSDNLFYIFFADDIEPLHNKMYNAPDCIDIPDPRTNRVVRLSLFLADQIKCTSCLTFVGCYDPSEGIKSKYRQSGHTIVYISIRSHIFSYMDTQHYESGS